MNGKTLVWFSASIRILGLVRAPRLDFNRSLGYCLVPEGEARGHLPKFVLDTTMVSFKRCLQR